MTGVDMQQTDPTQSTTVTTLQQIRDSAGAPASGLIATIQRFLGRPAFPADPYWYRAQFVIGAHAANAALESDPDGSSRDPDSQRAWQRARREARCLVTNVERALSAGIRGELRSFLDELEASALILLAGTFIGDDNQKMQLSDNLEADRDRALEMAQTERVNSDFLITMVTGSLPMSPRAHYNIACYFSSKAVRLAHQPGRKTEERSNQIDACYSKSIDELELALSGLDSSMKQAAANDASLGGVKEYRRTRDKFSRLVSAKSQ